MLSMLTRLLSRLACRVDARRLARRILLRLIPRPQLVRLIRWAFPPVMGGDGTEGDLAGDAGEERGENSDAEDSDDAEGDVDDPGPDDGERQITLTKEEYEQLVKDRNEANRLRREAAERSRKERERKRKEAEEQGKWEQIARSLEEERDAALAGEQEAREELRAFQREVRVTRIATRLGFRDPDDALRFLADGEADDDNQCERALKRIASEKPYLIADQVPTRTGVSVGGEGGSNQPKGLREAIQARVGA